jgi:hypothetical protein
MSRPHPGPKVYPTTLAAPRGLEPRATALPYPKLAFTTHWNIS